MSVLKRRDAIDFETEGAFRKRVVQKSSANIDAKSSLKKKNVLEFERVSFLLPVCVRILC